ncbi:hypothetical protein PVAP13_6NG330700 [Panicum virgatum]|uniref:Uncharacterized protein n=1 Tax=Panicum virgatum TaxID=38727 RepID=A0A8T0R3Y0_PANVG|nr:hypothetical protein PVAP13_6NG330700 [Panicum virgatum]
MIPMILNLEKHRLGTTLYGLWEVACSFSRAIGVHTKAAGPLFFAVAEFQSLGNWEQFNQALTIAAVLTSIFEPYTKGYFYNAGRSLELSWLGSDVDRMLKESILFVCSNWQNTCNSDVIETSSNNEADYIVETGTCRCHKRSRPATFHSNILMASNDSEKSQHLSTLFDIQHFSTSSSACDPRTGYDTFKRSMIVRIMSRFYISLSCLDRRACLRTRHTMNHLDSTNNSGIGHNWPVIYHCIPKHIEVTIGTFKSQLDGSPEIVMDMFDAIISRYNELCDSQHKVGSSARTRHLFESSFLGSILAGMFDVTSPLIRDQIVGTHITYKISSCSMMLFPCIIGHRWVSYAWCLQTNTIFIFDPICNETTVADMMPEHMYVTGELKKAIKIVMKELD